MSLAKELPNPLQGMCPLAINNNNNEDEAVGELGDEDDEDDDHHGKEDMGNDDFSIDTDSEMVSDGDMDRIPTPQ